MKWRACPLIVLCVTTPAHGADAGPDSNNPVTAWVYRVELAISKLVLDSSGNVFVTGFFEGTVDLDPTDGVDEHTSHLWFPNPDLGPSLDICVSKYGPDGSYRWSRTVGGGLDDGASGVAVDADGSVLAVGSFGQTVDFDPSEGVDEHTANGLWDHKWFLMKLRGDGSYAWTNTPLTVSGTTNGSS